MLRTIFQITACSLAAFCMAGAAHANGYPSKPIRFVVPAGAGGGTDTVARVLAQKMGTTLGATIIVENKPGAGGQLGAEYVAASAADGYTLLFTSSSVLTLPYLRKTKFDLLRDFVPVGKVGDGTFSLVVNVKLPFNNLREFLAAAKANPGKYSYGSAGSGSAGHLAGELLQSKAHIELMHVPFKSSSEMSQALIAGQIDLSIDVLTVQKPQIEARKVRGLATTGPERDSFLPSLPTFNETGAIPGGYEITYWFALFLPAKVPAAIVEQLQRAFVASAKDPSFTSALGRFSLRPSTLDAAAFRKSLESESQTWRKIIAEKGLTSQE